MITRITPCPIIEATIHIFCKFSASADLAAGQVFSTLKSWTGEPVEVENLPILNLPEDIRLSDPNLKTKPWYRFVVKNYQVFIGPSGIALGIQPPYLGWTDFKKFTVDFLSEISNKDIVSDFEALSLKYLDFFRNVNVFEVSRCSINIGGDKVTSIPTILRTEIQETPYIKSIQISNGVHVVNQVLELDDDGSLIEIGIYTDSINLSKFQNILDEAHAIQKKLFFGLLKEEFLKTFNVEKTE